MFMIAEATVDAQGVDSSIPADGIRIADTYVTWCTGMIRCFGISALPADTFVTP